MRATSVWLAVVVVVACGAAWWLLRDDDGLDDPEGVRPPAPPKVKTEGEGPRDPSVAAPSTTSKFVERPAPEEGVDAEARFDPPVTKGRLVRVVRKADGTPIAGATVHFGENQYTMVSRLQTLMPGGFSRLIRQVARYRWRTDVRGETRIPIVRQRAGLVVVTEDGAITKEIRGGAAGELLIEVPKGTHVDVKVVDPQDNPVPDVQVALRMHSTQLAVSAVTDEAGIARLERLEVFAFLLRAPELAVGFAAPMKKTVQVSFDGSNPPSTPLTLVLRDTAPLSVRVVTDRGDPVGGAHVVVTPATTNRDPDFRSGTGATTSANGTITFPNVGMGMKVDVRVWTDALHDPLVATTTITEQRGAVTECDVIWPTQSHEIGLQLQDPGGRALAGQVVHYGRTIGADQVTSDDNGRIAFDVPRDLAGGGRFLLATRGSFAEIEWAALKPGMNDLGSVRLRTLPTVAAGSVVDQDGNPAPLAHISVSQGWSQWNAMTDQSGRFVVRATPRAVGSPPGAVTSGQVDIAVEAPGFATVQLENQPIGKHDHRIVIAPGGSCALLVKTPIGMAPRDLQAMMTSALVGTTGIPEVVGPGSIRFRWDELPTGSHTITLALAEFQSTLHTLEDIAVEPGTEVDDPRLEVDVRHLVSPFDVKVVNAQGTPIAGAGVRLLPDPPYNRVGVIELDNGNRAPRFVPRAPDRSLCFSAPGFTPRTLTLPMVETEVVLRQGPRVRLVLGGTPVPQGCRLIGWMVGRVPAAGVHEVTFDADGRTESIPLNVPGRYVLSFALRKHGDNDDLDGVTRTFEVADSGGSTVDLKLSLTAEEFAKGAPDR